MANANFSIFGSARQVERFFQEASVVELMDAGDKLGQVRQHLSGLSYSTVGAYKRACRLLQDELAYRRIVL